MSLEGSEFRVHRGFAVDGRPGVAGLSLRFPLAGALPSGKLAFHPSSQSPVPSLGDGEGGAGRRVPAS